MADVVFEVYNPSGTVDMMRAPAPRVKDLHGKRVGMQWNGVFRGDETFPFLQQLLKERFPDADILDYRELPKQPASSTDAETIGRTARLRGCDAVIAGNGG